MEVRLGPCCEYAVNRSKLKLLTHQKGFSVIRVLGIILSIFLYSSAHAAKASKVKSTKRPTTQQSLTYYQWAKLSKKDKAEYIKGLQVISFRWEAGQKFLGYSQNQGASTNKWALLSEMILTPSVAADPEKCKKIEFGYAPNELCISGRWPWSLTYCSRKYNSPREHAILCQDKFKEFSITQRAKLQEADLAGFDAMVKRHTLNPSATKMREVHGPNPSANMPGMHLEKPGDLPPSSESEVVQTIALEAADEQFDVKCETGTSCGENADALTTEELRQNYRSEMDEKFPQGGQPCVVAGFVSVLKENKMCRAVSDFGIGKWKGRCPGKQTMCNPVVFGFDPAGGPICANVNMQVTARCLELAEEVGNTPEVISAQLSGTSGLKSLADIATEDFADAWERQKSGMGKLCTEKTSSIAFFCRECTVMNQQIRSINVGSECANQCGEVSSSGTSCRPTSSESPAASGPAETPQKGDR